MGIHQALANEILSSVQRMWLPSALASFSGVLAYRLVLRALARSTQHVDAETSADSGGMNTGTPPHDASREGRRGDRRGRVREDPVSTARREAEQALRGVRFIGALCSSGTQGPISVSSLPHGPITDSTVACQNVLRTGMLFCGIFHANGNEALAISAHARWLAADLIVAYFEQHISPILGGPPPPGGAQGGAPRVDPRLQTPAGRCLLWRRVLQRVVFDVERNMVSEYSGDNTTDTAVSIGMLVVHHGTLAVTLAGDCACVLGYQRQSGGYIATRVGENSGVPILSGAAATPASHEEILNVGRSNHGSTAGNTSARNSLARDDAAGATLALAVLTTKTVVEILGNDTLVQLAASGPCRVRGSSAQIITRFVDREIFLRGGVPRGNTVMVVDFRTSAGA